MIKNNKIYLDYTDSLDKREKLINSFWINPLLKQMVEDIKESDYPLTNFEWKLFPEKIRQKFYWGEDVYDNYISALIMTLSSEKTPSDSKTVDENLITMKKMGLTILIYIENNQDLVVKIEK